MTWHYRRGARGVGWFHREKPASIRRPSLHTFCLLWLLTESAIICPTPSPSQHLHRLFSENTFLHLRSIKYHAVPLQVSFLIYYAAPVRKSHRKLSAGGPSKQCRRAFHPCSSSREQKESQCGEVEVVTQSVSLTSCECSEQGLCSARAASNILRVASAVSNLVSRNRQQAIKLSASDARRRTVRVGREGMEVALSPPSASAASEDLTYFASRASNYVCLPRASPQCVVHGCLPKR